MRMNCVAAVFIAVCRRGVCASGLCRRNHIVVCKGGVCVSDLCRRSYVGVCRGGLCESDLCPRRVARKRVMWGCPARVSSKKCLT